MKLFKNFSFKKMLLKTLLGFILAFTFLYFFTNNYNATQYTITNGKRTIVFQSMIHYADQSFFDAVNSEIEHYKSKGYKHYYEMVKTENEAKFKRFLGIEGFDDSVFGMARQQEHMKIEDDDVNADVNGEELFDMEYNFTNELLTNSVFIEEREFEKEDFISKEMEQHLYQRALILGAKSAIYTNNLGMYVMLGKEKADYIIKTRNDVLIDFIEETDDDLFITYGEAHFKDFMKKMETKGYKIVNEKDIRAISL